MSGARFARAVVAGAKGGFGRTFCALLAADGSEVTGIDTRAAEDGGTHAIAADAAAPPPEALAALARADVLVLCLPEAPLFAALAVLVRALSSGALVVDTTSVKSRYVAAVTELRDDVELYSIEPMFAPDVGFAGQDLIAIPVRDGPRSQAFRGLLGTTGARVVEMSVDEHDRQAAATQVAAHAALLAYGTVLRRLGFDPSAPSTPVQRTLLALVARIATRDAGVYWHIQRDNPHGPGGRAALRDALAALDDLVARDDEAGFRALVAETAEALGPDLAALAQRSARIVQS
ncbi:MAG: Prephenate/arogenate dehydrogenase [Candidatus Eremiobacteraeota bacterium]|nr:Prephenate/arogenate dehydrogenase [Candidatus Eremiobacteraeota bacterium]